MRDASTNERTTENGDWTYDRREDIVEKSERPEIRKEKEAEHAPKNKIHNFFPLPKKSHRNAMVEITCRSEITHHYDECKEKSRNISI